MIKEFFSAVRYQGLKLSHAYMIIQLMLSHRSEDVSFFSGS